ncbi:uncharacterized protein MONBRDRAFT_1294, partial [Monosiga brevicollis MX1]
FFIYIAICATLVLAAGIFSGLTLGLLSFDITHLQVVIQGGSERDCKRAQNILPLVSRHHLLLVTLLLSNAAVCEALPLFLDDLVSEYVAIAISVTAVLFFGEVIPQALCSKHGLAIGSFFTPFVWLMIILLFPIAWPLSKLLDCILGENHSAFFRRSELGAFVQMHGDDSTGNEEPLSSHEIDIIRGALELNDKVAADAMQPLECVFCLPFDERLSLNVMEAILDRGHSRIPVYRDSPTQMQHFILTKRLIKYRPEDGTPISEVPKHRLNRVDRDLPLYDLLNEFKNG